MKLSPNPLSHAMDLCVDPHAKWSIFRLHHLPCVCKSWAVLRYLDTRSNRECGWVRFETGHQIELSHEHPLDTVWQKWPTASTHLAKDMTIRQVFTIQSHYCCIPVNGFPALCDLVGLGAADPIYWVHDRSAGATRAWLNISIRSWSIP